MKTFTPNRRTINPCRPPTFIFLKVAFAIPPITFVINGKNESTIDSSLLKKIFVGIYL